MRLLRPTCWCGLSNHQAATAQMHLVGKAVVECRPLLGALPPSLRPSTRCFSLLAAWAGSQCTGPRVRACGGANIEEDQLWVWPSNKFGRESKGPDDVKGRPSFGAREVILQWPGTREGRPFRRWSSRNTRFFTNENQELFWNYSWRNHGKFPIYRTWYAWRMPLSAVIVAPRGSSKSSDISCRSAV